MTSLIHQIEACVAICAALEKRVQQIEHIVGAPGKTVTAPAQHKPKQTRKRKRGRVSDGRAKEIREIVVREPKSGRRDIPHLMRCTGVKVGHQMWYYLSAMVAEGDIKRVSRGVYASAVAQ